MFAVTGPHNASDNITLTSSLSHTLIFHANPDKLLFTASMLSAENSNDPSSWAILEQFGDSASEGRGLVRSRIWSADGTLLASVVQDAMIRVRVDEEEETKKEGWTGKTDKRKITFSERLRSML
ncbi:hypothetical protein ABW19_dt0207750 [Dactylella cylindrospora]|nr:hypothetical protein ABW19_dt0207750 [Dactylella cylindrospora]